MRGTKLAGLCLCAIALVAAAGAQESPYVLSGAVSFSGAGSWLDDGAFQASDLGWASDSAVELALDVKRPGIRASALGRVDVLTGGTTPGLTARLERAYVRWTTTQLVATAGRQVVNWGNAMLWSPADLFAQTSIVGLAPERAGTDAVRLAMPIGALGGIEAVAVPTARLAGGRYGGRLYGYALDSDCGLEAAWDGAAGATTIAANIKTNLVVGLWAEAAVTIPDYSAESSSFRTTIGADWSFGSNLVIAAEYRYDQRPDANGGFAGTHCLYATATQKAGDFAVLALSLIADIGNAIVAPTVSAVLDIAQDASLTTWAGWSSGNFATLGISDSARVGLTMSLAF
jgi:opacity protein-like surface antigen